MQNKNYVFLDIETTGLDPFTDRITCICAKCGVDQECFMDQDEAKMLREFWGWLSAIPDPVIVGFNIYTFDIPFIHKRCLKHDVGAPFCLKENYIDLRFELKYPSSFGTFEQYLNFIDLRKNGDGLKAIELWRNERYDELKKYCMMDVELVEKLFERCLKSGIIRTER